MSEQLARYPAVAVQPWRPAGLRTGPRPAAPARRSRHAPPLWLTTLVVLISLPMLIPFAYIFIRSSDVGLQRALELVFRERVWMLFGNTVYLLVLVTVSAVVLGAFAAFLLERCKVHGAPIWRVTSTLPLCIPAFVASYGWISLTFRVEGLPGAVLVLTMTSAPLAFLPVSAVLRRMDRSFEEVSLSLGRSRAFTFRRVVLPQLRPALGDSFLLIALHMLIEFGAVSMLNYSTFTTAIYQEYDMSFDNASAALLSLVLVVLCLIVVGVELLFRGHEHLVRQGTGVARPAEKRPLTPVQQGFVQLFFALMFVLGIGVPVVMVCYWLYVGTSLQTAFHWLQFFRSLGVSLGVSSGGALVSVLAAMPLVWVAVRYRTWLTIWVERLPFLLHAVPGIVIALGLTFFSIRYAYPIYQTWIPVLIAYLMLYLPMAQTTLGASLRLVPSQVENVGRSLGRTDFFVFRTLVVPAILPGVAAAFALVFLNLMKELTATLVLTPGEVQTMAVSVWELTAEGAYAAVAPYAVALILFSGVPVYLLKKYGFN